MRASRVLVQSAATPAHLTQDVTFSQMEFHRREFSIAKFVSYGKIAIWDRAFFWVIQLKIGFYALELLMLMGI